MNGQYRGRLRPPYEEAGETPARHSIVAERDPDRFEPLGARHHFHVDALAFGELVDAIAGEHRAVDEDILAAFHGDKAEALLRVVPLDLAVDLFGRPGGGAIERARRTIAHRPSAAATPARSRTARRFGRAGIDVGDLGDLGALLPLPDPHRQRRAGF